MKQPILFLLFMLAATASSAEIYKWVDEQGKVHYGDTPVDQSSTQMNITQPEADKKISSQPDPTSRDERRRKLAEAMQEDRLKKQEQKQKARDEKEKLNSQCVHAKDALKNYETAGRLYNLDKDGNRVFMSDAEKEATTENLRAQIKKHCE
jgi:hypothetical protein